MSYRQLVVGHAVFVRWNRVELRELDEVLALARGVRAREGRDVLYVGLQYDDFETPGPEVRRAVLPVGKQLASISSAYYIVVAATGVAASLQRTLIRALVVAARAAGIDTSKVRIADSVDEVFERERRELPCPATELKQKLAAASMLG